MSTTTAIPAYENLKGAEGRRVYYRAERHNVRDVFRKVLPEIEIDHVPFTLHDLSTSGLAVFGARDGDWQGVIGGRVPVELRLGRVSLFAGEGEVCRIEPTPFGPKVGIRLTDGCLDITTMIARHNEFALRAELDCGLGESRQLIDPDYRRLCADVLDVTRQCRNFLDRIEAQAPTGDGDDARVADALSFCEERALPRLIALWHQANRLVAPIMTEPDALAATKRFTEALLTPEFLPGPIARRSYEKPYGYPGDFRVMDHVYRWRREGETAYGKLAHRVALEVAKCIATRMSEMQEVISRVIADRALSGPARITSLACGPAQEVANVLRADDAAKPVHVTLIDQDIRALDFAYERAYPESVRRGSAVRLDCLHASFSQLIKAGALIGGLQPQDLIYSLGLFDYLTARRAKALIMELYDRLAPGGRLVIGNMRAGPTAPLWPMEFICDWSLIYRNEAEMRDLAAGLEADAVELKTDSTGSVYLLSLRRP